MDLGRLFMDQFFSSIEGNVEKEMSPSMLCFTLAIVRAFLHSQLPSQPLPQIKHTILEHKTGVYVTKPIHTDVIVEPYTSSGLLLQSLFEKKLKQYHKTMVELLQMYMSGQYPSHITNH
jgi:hypothetical protein